MVWHCSQELRHDRPFVPRCGNRFVRPVVVPDSVRCHDRSAAERSALACRAEHGRDRFHKSDARGLNPTTASCRESRKRKVVKKSVRRNEDGGAVSRFNHGAGSPDTLNPGVPGFGPERSSEALHGSRSGSKQRTFSEPELFHCASGVEISQHAT